jgi:ABC-2 type transport system permease protein
MNLWRLEWLRVVRAHRLIALAAVYVFFGLLGPFTARYLGEFLERFGGEVSVEFPPPVPADGIAQYTANANQIGLLVAVIVAAGALVIDAIPEMSIYLRTRVTSMGTLLRPRFVVSAAVIWAAFLAGLVAAWYETVVLLGSIPVGALALGASFTLVYLAFVVALVGAIGSRSSTVLATVAVSIVILLVLPLLGLVEAIGRWLPSYLLGAMDALLRDTEPAGEFLPATLITVALTAGLVRAAAIWARKREL